MIVSPGGNAVAAYLLERLRLTTPIVSSAGADNIKKYWSRYYQGSQGVVFVLDSASSDEDLEAARNELHSALQHPQLCTLPFLILANHQDKPAARTPNQVPSQHPTPCPCCVVLSRFSHRPKTPFRESPYCRRA